MCPVFCAVVFALYTVIILQLNFIFSLIYQSLPEWDFTPLVVEMLHHFADEVGTFSENYCALDLSRVALCIIFLCYVI